MVAKPCLLIVDDEPDMVAFVSDVAEDMGFSCASAENGLGCLELFQSVSPVGIVLDIVMPDMDGIELVRELANHDCAAPIIAMSGYQKMYLELLESLANDQNAVVLGSLSKPFTASELQALLKQLLESLD
ncbi:MAG: response regulator [Rhodospirillales bacterium]|nr:response regulator [Rhodospirillales bacterium]MBO6786764.1 response regulator [Rhodospirillales bacterium]